MMLDAIRPARLLARARPAVGAALAGALLASALSAHANPLDMSNVLPGEWTRLPEYCPYTIVYAGGPPRDEWFARLGPSFQHLHHYCWSILKAYRATVPGITPLMRRTLYTSAIDECAYVFRNASKDLILMPEILYRVGTYHVQLENWVEAIEYFNRSRSAKVDYWPPYVEIANVNARLGRQQQAIAVLKEALEVMPGEVRLTEALKRIESMPPTRARSAP